MLRPSGPNSSTRSVHERHSTLPGPGEAAQHGAAVEVGVVGVRRQQVVARVGAAAGSGGDRDGAPAAGVPPEDAALPRRQQHPAPLHAQHAGVVGEAALGDQRAGARGADADRGAAPAAGGLVHQPASVLGEADAPRARAQQRPRAVVGPQPQDAVGAQPVALRGAEDEGPPGAADEGEAAGVDRDPPVAVHERGAVDVGDGDVGARGAGPPGRARWSGRRPRSRGPAARRVTTQRRRPGLGAWVSSEPPVVSWRLEDHLTRRRADPGPGLHELVRGAGSGRQ